MATVALVQELTAIISDKVWVNSGVEHFLYLLYRALYHLLHKLAMVCLLHRVQCSLIITLFQLPVCNSILETGYIKVEQYQISTRV